MSSAEHQVDNVSRETPSRGCRGFTLRTPCSPAINIEGCRHSYTFSSDSPDPFGKEALLY